MPRGQFAKPGSGQGRNTRSSATVFAAVAARKRERNREIENDLERGRSGDMQYDASNRPGAGHMSGNENGGSGGETHEENGISATPQQANVEGARGGLGAEFLRKESEESSDINSCIGVATCSGNGPGGAASEYHKQELSVAVSEVPHIEVAAATPSTRPPHSSDMAHASIEFDWESAAPRVAAVGGVRRDGQGGGQAGREEKGGGVSAAGHGICDGNNDGNGGQGEVYGRESRVFGSSVGSGSVNVGVVAAHATDSPGKCAGGTGNAMKGLMDLEAMLEAWDNPVIGAYGGGSTHRILRYFGSVSHCVQLRKLCLMLAGKEVHRHALNIKICIFAGSKNSKGSTDRSSKLIERCFEKQTSLGRPLTSGL